MTPHFFWVSLLLLLGGGETTDENKPALAKESRLVLSNAQGEPLLELFVDEMSGNAENGIEMVGVQGVISLEESVTFSSGGGGWDPSTQIVRLDRVEMIGESGWKLVAEEVWYVLLDGDISTEGSFSFQYQRMLLTGKGLRVDLETLSGRVEERAVLESIRPPSP
ncbi:hypothetical protein H8D30_03965 [bacterium]|nr:hypothetical protein [bacterium]